MGVCWNKVLIGCAAVALFAGPAIAQPAPSYSTAGNDKGCMPKLEGPIGATADSKPYSRIAAAPPGYVEEEFFISCDVQGKPYKTLIHVVRPTNPEEASGILTVEPWHGGNNWTLFSSIRGYLLRTHGTAMIVIARPRILTNFIHKADPKRYASLSLPDLPLTESEVLAHAGAFVKTKGIPGVVMRHMVLGGHSDTGSRTRHFILEQHAQARINGKSIYDGYFPLQAELSTTNEPLPDTDVPVIEIQGERELIEVFNRGKTSVVYRRADGPFYRLYEVPGMSHVNTRRPATPPAPTAIVGSPNDAPRPPAYSGPANWNCQSKNLSPFPRNEVIYAAFHRLVRWIVQKEPAPHAPRIETRDNGRTIVRDQYGNAKGGVRTVYFDVPIATYHAVNGSFPGNPQAQRCDWIGYYTPLSREELLKLYPTHMDYVTKFYSEINSLVKDGWYLPEDAGELREEADNAKIP